jgi:transposase-like protein
MNRISKKVKTEAVKDYRGGMTLRQVASKYGVSSESVRRWTGSKVRARGKRIPVSDPNQMSLMPIAKRGIRTRKSPFNTGVLNANKRWTKLDDEVLRDAVLDNMTVDETKSLLGRSEASIYSRKTILIDRGFIDENLRFPVPQGVKRNRPTGIVPKKEEVSEEIKTNPVDLGKIGLSELAQIVRDYGVGVTLSVTQQGTEVKLHN